MYLKFILTETEFRILEQEGIKSGTRFHSSNEIFIIINSMPSFSRYPKGGKLWLRGSDTTKDYYLCSHTKKKEILIAIEEFFNQDEMPNRGDTITVGEDRERIFVTYIKGATCPWICVQEGDNGSFRNGQPYRICTWKERKIIKAPLINLGCDVYEIGVKNEI